MKKNKKLEQLDIFELNEMASIAEKLRSKYDQEFASYGLCAIQNEAMLTPQQRAILVKRRLLQEKYSEIMEIIENKLLNDYVKED